MLTTVEKRQGTTPQGKDFHVVVATTSGAIRPAVHTSYKEFVEKHNKPVQKQAPRWLLYFKTLIK